VENFDASSTTIESIVEEHVSSFSSKISIEDSLITIPDPVDNSLIDVRTENGVDNDNFSSNNHSVDNRNFDSNGNTNNNSNAVVKVIPALCLKESYDLPMIGYLDYGNIVDPSLRNFCKTLHRKSVGEPPPIVVA
jgi:hypothetical protein